MMITVLVFAVELQKVRTTFIACFKTTCTWEKNDRIYIKIKQVGLGHNVITMKLDVI